MTVGLSPVIVHTSTMRIVINGFQGASTALINRHIHPLGFSTTLTKTISKKRPYSIGYQIWH